MAFLSDELKVMSRHEADDRVYFVSAKEALSSRTNGQGTPMPGKGKYDKAPLYIA